MMEFFAYSAAALGCVCFAAYFLRMVKLHYKTQRIDYVALHGFLGAGLIVAIAKLLVTKTVDIDSMAAIGTAVSHLSVTHQRGVKFVPPAYMNSKAGNL